MANVRAEDVRGSFDPCDVVELGDEGMVCVNFYLLLALISTPAF